MPERDASGRIRLVAVGAAVLSLVFACVAVIVVLTRDGEPATPKAEEPSPPLRDHEVLATDVVRLRREAEVVIDNGAPKGLRVKDATLARALGLEVDDVITSISGRQMTSERDPTQAIAGLSMMSATTLYVEISRGDKPMLLRWRLEGDLRKARYASTSSSTTSSYGSSGGLGALGSTYAPTDQADPLLDTIVRVDDTHTKVPRAILEAMLGDAQKYAKGARIVPSIRNGQPNGLKLYAIRPSSVFRLLGFQNGDTVHAINGASITTVDDALELYAKIRYADELTFEVTRRGHPVVLTVEITK